MVNMSESIEKDFVSVDLADMASNEHQKVQYIEEGKVTIIVYGDILIDESLADIGSLPQLYNLSLDLSSFYQQLSGCFWLLVVDAAKQRVTLVNDQLGMQACYYAKQANKLLVSSSLKTLKAKALEPFTLSKQAIFNYIYFHCIPSPSTIYQQAAKLEPSKALIFAKGKQLSQTLYRPKFASHNINISALQTQCLSVIEQAVKGHITDNCGAFLSGGLDSSTVAGMLAKSSKKAKTFSIGFTLASYDETPYAKLTAKHFNTQHRVLYLQSEHAADEFVKVAQYFDEPFGNSSAMAAYFCAKFAKQQGVTTLLAGDGGDELFAGNERYAKQKVFEAYQKVPYGFQKIAKGIICHTPISKLPLFNKAASYINQAEIKLPERLHSYNFVNQLGHEAIFEDDFLAEVDSRQPIEQLQSRYDDCTSDDPVDCMLYLDWKFTLADNDLLKVNKMCEFAGVKVRYPLLDKAVVDFSCKIAAHEKLPRSTLRKFYKDSCRGFLADQTLTKSKHGFGLPFGAWMKENRALKTLTLNTLNAFKKRNIVKDSLIDNALNAHQNVHTGYFGELIWILVVLELWLQKYE